MATRIAIALCKGVEDRDLHEVLIGFGPSLERARCEAQDRCGSFPEKLKLSCFAAKTHLDPRSNRSVPALLEVLRSCGDLHDRFEDVLSEVLRAGIDIGKREARATKKRRS